MKAGPVATRDACRSNSTASYFTMGFTAETRLRLEAVPRYSYRHNGIFDAATPESFVSLLEKEPDLSDERQGDEVIVRPHVCVNQ
jgi:hypothetical protein